MSRYLSLPLFLRVGLLAALGFLLVLFVSPVHAGDYIARQGADSVRLTDKPCPDEVVAKIPDQFRGEILRLANVVWQGSMYRACWRVTDHGAHLLFDDGDQGLIGFDLFKPAQDL